MLVLLHVLSLQHFPPLILEELLAELKSDLWPEWKYTGKTVKIYMVYTDILGAIIIARNISDMQN